MKEKDFNIVYVAVDDLVYDKENPRLPHSVVDSDQEQHVVEWMLKDASIIELMGSIGEKGFFPAEPLLVVRRGTSKKYTVVEGNRRLTAVKLLRNPKLATKRTAAIKAIVDEASIIPDRLPVMEFSKRKDILDYLGFKHITGVKQWSSLAKAKYLKELKGEYELSNLPINDQYKKLAKAIGSRADYVRDLLIGLYVYEIIHAEKYFGIKNLNEDTIDFGVYYNALKYSNIPKYLGIDKNIENPTININISKLETLTRIISDEGPDGVTKLGESRNLSALNSIILEKRPFEMFRSGRTLDEAVLYLEGPQEIFRNSLQRINSLLGEAELALRELKNFSQSDVKQVSEIKGQIVQIEKKVNQKSPTGKKRNG